MTTQTEALKRIAAYPFSRAEELSVEQMREIAREALAQPEQEHVAYPCIVVDVDYSMDTAAILIQDTRDYEFNNGQYWLTTTPPQRKPWVSLSDEDIERIAKKARSKDHAITLAIRELKERNT